MQLDGVLFLEGEGRPAEISHLIRDLRNAAEDQKVTGEWLAKAMESSWAADILEHVDFTPATLRTDLADGRVSIGLLYSAAEMISHAADLCSASAGLVHDNERRWRTFADASASHLASRRQSRRRPHPRTAIATRLPSPPTTPAHVSTYASTWLPDALA